MVAADILNVLCALAVVFLPMLFAWFAVSRGVRRHHDLRKPPLPRSGDTMKDSQALKGHRLYRRRRRHPKPER